MSSPQQRVDHASPQASSAPLNSMTMARISVPSGVGAVGDAGWPDGRFTLIDARALAADLHDHHRR
jgi:hypothetical protein